MADQNAKGKKGMSEFELGASLSRIEAKVDGALASLAQFATDAIKRHDDHENRVRELESKSATKQDVLNVHARLDLVVEKQWKTWLYLAILAGGAGGSVGLIIKMAVGG